MEILSRNNAKKKRERSKDFKCGAVIGRFQRHRESERVNKHQAASECINGILPSGVYLVLI